MSTTRVAVVVPVYNVEKFLRRCLESVVNQTHEDLEIICVNDASPDRSEAILAEYACLDKRITLLRHAENQGLGPARMTGTAAVTSKWIMFLDSDDRMPLDAIERLLDLAETHGADIVKGSNSYEYADGSLQERPRFVQRDESYEVLSGIEVLERILGLRPSPYIPVSMCGTLYRTALFRDYGIIHPSTYQEDFGTTPFLMAVAKRVVLTDEIVLFYYQRENSEMRRPYDRRRLKSYCALYEHMRDTFKRLGIYETYHLAFSRKFVRAITQHIRFKRLRPTSVLPYARLVRRVLREGTDYKGEQAFEFIAPLLHQIRSVFRSEGLTIYFPLVVFSVLPPKWAISYFASYFISLVRGKANLLTRNIPLHRFELKWVLIKELLGLANSSSSMSGAVLFVHA
jgi:glycosyltransferase involved in cell wall biosynthesis